MNKLFFALFILIAIGCDDSSKDYTEEGDYSSRLMSEALPATMTMQPAAKDQAVQVQESFEKRVIKNGGINFQTEDLEEDYRKVTETLRQYDAYIENENQSNTPDQISYNLTIRVPANKYDSLFAALSNITDQVDNKYSNLEDVSERYYDLESRIRNKKALEDRYLELLDKAKDIKALLEVERNLNEVRTEIEQLEGQFKHLSQRISLSTIHLNFYEVQPYVYDSSQRTGFGARILNALLKGWQSLLSFAVGLIGIWPFLLIIVGFVYLFRNWISRKKNMKEK